MRYLKIILTGLLLVAGLTLLWPQTSQATFGEGDGPDTSGPAAVTIPPQFTDAVVTSGLSSPTALAFLPDGRMLVTAKEGQLIRYKAGASPEKLTVLDLNTTGAGKVCSNSERGLLGIAVDLDFANNRYIYLYYTFNRFNQNRTNCGTGSQQPVNRVSRFQFTTATGDALNASTETVLLDYIPSAAGNHNGGDLHFGADGKLYISAGDGGCEMYKDGTDNTDSTRCGGGNRNSRSRNILGGKILRINKDGSIPADNPYASTPGTRRCGDPSQNNPVLAPPANAPFCQETWDWGLRNPFRFAMRPGTSDFYINDVGQGIWEEIDASSKNADYGWNVREGFCANGSTSDCGAPPAGMTNPLFAYQHDGENCDSITGGAFVPTGLWPGAYSGQYLFSDYVCGKIWRLDAAGGGTYTRTLFASGLLGPVYLAFGPYNGANGQNQALYIVEIYTGTIRRQSFTGSANRPPVAVIGATPKSGPVPLNVSFSAAGSSDPDNDALTYYWTFGDNGATEVSTGSTPTTSHQYTAAGTFYARLRVKDTSGAFSSYAQVRLDPGNTPPTPTIIAPANGTTFSVGQVFTLQGSATDDQDGPLAANRLSWTVIKHHDTHTHPFYGPVVGNNLVMPPAPEPEDFSSTQNTYLEIQLTATDSAGLSATVTRSIYPKIVDVTLASVPTGVGLTVNGQTFPAPHTFKSWAGLDLNLEAPGTVQSSGQTYNFSAWSDGGTALHEVTTPTGAVTYTASYVQGCAPKVVTVNTDTTNNPGCGTLRYALNIAAPNDTVDLTTLPDQTTITLADSLVINKKITLKANCATGPNGKARPGVILDGNGQNKVGLALSGGVTVEGLKIVNFGKQLIQVVKPSGGNGDNVLRCMVISKKLTS